MISRLDINPAQPTEFLKTYPVFEDEMPDPGDLRLKPLLGPILGLLALGFAAAAGWQSIFGQDAVLLQRLALAIAVFLLILRLTARQFDLLAGHPHWTATIAAGTVMAYAVFSMGVSKAPWSTIYLAAVVLAPGFLFTSRTCFYGLAIFAGLGWFGAASRHLDTPGWVELGVGLLAAIVTAGAMFELRQRRLTRWAREAQNHVRKAMQQGATVNSAQAETGHQWCPVCKASPDAIIHHNGETVLDANAVATDLFGMSVEELSMLPVSGIFSPQTRDNIIPILRLGNFTAFETMASGIKDSEIPVEVFCGGLTLETNGRRALVIRDLREIQKIREVAADTSRRAQVFVRRQAELAAFADREDTAESLDETLGKIVQAIHRLLPATIGAMVVLWDNQAEGFTVAANSAVRPLETSNISLDDESLFGRLTAAPEKIIVQNVNEDDYGIRRLYKHEPVRAFVALPLVNAAGVIGILLALERSPKEFTIEDIDFLTLAAHRATCACNNVMMTEQLNVE